MTRFPIPHLIYFPILSDSKYTPFCLLAGVTLLPQREGDPGVSSGIADKAEEGKTPRVAPLEREQQGLQ